MPLVIGFWVGCSTQQLNQLSSPADNLNMLMFGQQTLEYGAQQKTGMHVGVQDGDIKLKWNLSPILELCMDMTCSTQKYVKDSFLDKFARLVTLLAFAL